nr:hypothetical protein [Spirochaetota bacterium]
ASVVDIIITSVTCHDYLLTYPMIKTIIQGRGNRPLFIIDIAVPRNVDPEVVSLDNVILYNIDNLKEIADRNLENRLNEVNAAMEIVHDDANDLLEWYEGLEMVPMIVKMQESFDRIREDELAKFRRRQLKNLSEEDIQVVDDLTKQIISKILHNPIMAIKQNSALNLNGYHNKEDIKQKLKIIEELFKI